MAQNLLISILLIVHLTHSLSSPSDATEASKEPTILDGAEKLNYPEGSNGTLVCSIGSGELDSLTFEWFKDDKKIVPSQRYRISIVPENVNSILRVIDLKSDDSATYSCIARNAFGKDKLSIKLFVKVQLKWIAEPKGQLDVPVGKPLQVPCIADGQPMPKIVWTKLNDDGSTRVLSSELSFNTVGQDDAGLYECRAANGVEKDLVSRIKLNVLGK